MRVRAFHWIAVLVATSTFAAAAPPLAGVWNIAASGTAASSGDLEFRVTPADGTDPVSVTVPVIAGASEDQVARTIRRTLGSQLRRDRYRVELGEAGNVLLSDPRGRPSFSVELVDSGIDNLRIAVQSVTPAAAPTVPMQSAPAEAPPVNPPANTVPGNAAPPADTQPPDPITPPPRVPSGNVPVPSPGPATRAPSPAIPVPDPIRVPAPAPAVPAPQTPADPDGTPPPPPSTPPGESAPPPGSMPPPEPGSQGEPGGAGEVAIAPAGS
ncbi:MAG TPA: hypothetical protein VFP37_04675 [Steroidobacteraceae bacterium]|nr:hypothetical protein [Steroidobacteraceae bacterium]